MVNNTIKSNNDIFNRFKGTSRKVYKKTTGMIKRHPLMSFFISLGILLLLIILANITGTPKKQNVNTTAVAKTVTLYHIGSAPKISLPGKVTKSGVITITAQSGGVVQSINVTEGDNVDQGTTLIDLSSNYQGGDAPALQAQIAQDQYTTTQQTFGTQLDLLDRQRDVATASAENTDQIRQISQQSVDETNSLISQDQDIITSLNQNITNLTNTNTNDAMILQTKQLQSQFQAGLNQLQESVRQTQYQTNTSNPPTLLANLQKDIALKQLDVQQKTLELNKEVSGLQTSLAYVNASLMHPTSPVIGTVQRIFVTQGETVSPGTPLAVIQASDPNVITVVTIPNTIAKSISRIEPSILHLGNKTVTARPRFVSTEATDGSSYSALYDVPAESQSDTTNGGFITIDIPIGYPDTGKTLPFVPIDSVYQSTDESYLYLAKNGKAISQKVTLGNVYGKYVEVLNGLHDGDQVITDRTIINGDLVKTQ